MRSSALFGIAITVLALGWLASRYDFGGVGRVMESAEPTLLLAAIPFLVLSFALRAARWRLLFGDLPKPGWRNAFAAVSAGYLFNNLLPSHAGELVRTFLLARKEGIAQARVLGTVVLEKVFDLSVFVGLALVTVAARPVPDWLRQGALTLLVLGVISVAFLVFAPKIIAAAAAILVSRLDWLGGSAKARVRQMLESLAAGLGGLKAPRVLLRIALFTAFIWVSEIMLLSMVVAAFSLDLALVERLLVLVLIATGTLIPAAPGYVGTYEAFGVLAFDFLGQPHEIGLACVIALHAIQLAGASVLGVLGVVWLRDSLGIRAILQSARKQAEAPDAALPQPAPKAKTRAVVVALIFAWVVGMTAVFLALSGPPGLILRMERAWPGFADVRSRLASLFHRDYTY